MHSLSRYYLSHASLRAQLTLFLTHLYCIVFVASSRQYTIEEQNSVILVLNLPIEDVSIWSCLCLNCLEITLLVTLLYYPLRPDINFHLTTETNCECQFHRRKTGLMLMILWLKQTNIIRICPVGMLMFLG